VLQLPKSQLRFHTHLRAGLADDIQFAPPLHNLARVAQFLDGGANSHIASGYAKIINAVNTSQAC